MNNTIGRETILSGLLWRCMERVGAQGVQFIVSLVLARVLAPEVFGTVALINVFIAILAGLMIFPAAFSVGVQPDSGPSLIFITLPNVFQQAFSGMPVVGYVI